MKDIYEREIELHYLGNRIWFFVRKKRDISFYRNERVNYKTALR